MTYKSSKLGHTGLVFVCDQSSSVGVCMQKYKPLFVAVMICATLVNIETLGQIKLLTGYTIIIR